MVRTLIRTNLWTNPSAESVTGFFAAAVSMNTSSNWSVAGSNSLLLTSLGSTADCFAALGGDTGALRLGMQAGKTYTASATIYTPVALTNPGSKARMIYFYYRDSGGTYISVPSAAGPLTGAARVSVTVTIPAGATEAFIRLYNGSPTLGEIVYWDAILVEESPSVGGYFDGNTLESFDYVQKWTGAPNASTSEQYRIEYSEGYYLSTAIAEAKKQTLERILGSNPTLVRDGGTFNDVRYKGLEKVLTDNGQL